MRRIELRPRSREVTEEEAAGNGFLSELRKAKAHVCTDAANAIVEIQFSELDTKPLSAEAVASFRKNASLRCLSIRAPELIRQLLPEISSLPNLEELNVLGHWGLSARMIDYLSKAPSLGRLWLNDARIDQDIAEAIARLPHLTSLSLDDCRYPKGIDATLASMPHLKSLYISREDTQRPIGLKCLELFPELQCLWVNDVLCDQEAMRRIGGLTKLEELSLQYMGLNDEMLRELRTLTKMKRAILGNNYVTGGGLSHLGTWRDLEELSVFSTSFDDAGTKNLSQFPELKKFVGYDTSLSDVSIETLIKAKQLKLAWLGRSKITADGMERLRKELPECEVREFTRF